MVVLHKVLYYNFVGLKQIDKDFLAELELLQRRIKYHVILTKTDLVLQPVLAKRATMLMDQLKAYHRVIPEPLLVSSKTGGGIDHLRRHVLHAVGAGYLSRKSHQIASN